MRIAILIIILSISAGSGFAFSTECNATCQRWKQLSTVSEPVPVGTPYSQCFAKAAQRHSISPRLLAAVASGESSFNKNAVSDKSAIGLMQIRWPITAKHLGFGNRSQLFDACTNVDAGARYLSELIARYDGSLHHALAAYNYGPARVTLDSVPFKATQYSNYIYAHYSGLDNNFSGPATLLSLNARSSADKWAQVLSIKYPFVDFIVNKNADWDYEVSASGSSSQLQVFLKDFRSVFDV